MRRWPAAAGRCGAEGPRRWRSAGGPGWLAWRSRRRRRRPLPGPGPGPACQSCPGRWGRAGGGRGRLVIMLDEDTHVGRRQDTQPRATTMPEKVFREPNTTPPLSLPTWHFKNGVQKENSQRRIFAATHPSGGVHTRVHQELQESRVSTAAHCGSVKGSAAGSVTGIDGFGAARGRVGQRQGRNEMGHTHIHHTQRCQEEA